MKAKAQTLEGEWVEGYYVFNTQDEHLIMRDISSMFANKEIDPQTLQYQIGSKWYSYNNLQCAINMWEECMEAIGK